MISPRELKSRSAFGFWVVLAALMLTIGAGFALQTQQAALLRVELERRQWDAGELRRLRNEHQRLRNKEIPAAELERLRADHAALPRLRAELDTLARTGTPADHP